MKIIFIRHGEYESITGQLTKQGMSDVLSLIKRFEEISDDFKIYSSPAIRTKQTAQIISKELRLKYEEKKSLSLDGFDIEKIKELIKQSEKDTILVSHFPVINRALQSLTKEEKSFYLNMGEAFIFNTKEKTIQKLDFK